MKRRLQIIFWFIMLTLFFRVDAKSKSLPSPACDNFDAVGDVEKARVILLGENHSRDIESMLCFKALSIALNASQAELYLEGDSQDFYEKNNFFSLLVCGENKHHCQIWDDDIMRAETLIFVRHHIPFYYIVKLLHDYFHVLLSAFTGDTFDTFNKGDEIIDTILKSCLKSDKAQIRIYLRKNFFLDFLGYTARETVILKTLNTLINLRKENKITYGEIFKNQFDDMERFQEQPKKKDFIDMGIKEMLDVFSKKFIELARKRDKPLAEKISATLKLEKNTVAFFISGKGHVTEETCPTEKGCVAVIMKEEPDYSHANEL